MADERRLCIIPLPIMRDPELSDHAKLVAVAIGAFMRRDGACAPGTDQIAALRGCSIRHAQRGIDELRKRKHLTTQQHQRQAATLQWLHPLTGQDGVASNPLLTGQKSHLDRTKSGALRVFDRTLPVTRAGKNEVVNEDITRGKHVHTERFNSKHHDTEHPVHDLDQRQRRSDRATPLAGAFTQFLGRPRALDKSPAPTHTDD